MLAYAYAPYLEGKTDSTQPEFHRRLQHLATCLLSPRAQLYNPARRSAMQHQCPHCVALKQRVETRACGKRCAVAVIRFGVHSGSYLAPEMSRRCTSEPLSRWSCPDLAP